MKKNPKSPTLTAQKILMVGNIVILKKQQSFPSFYLSLFLCCYKGSCLNHLSYLSSFSSTEKTRDELRIQVYDAMAEKNEEKKNEDTEKVEEKQSEEKETKDDVEKAEAGEDQHETAKEGDEEKKSEVNESKSDESEDKTEKDEEAEKEPEDKEEEEAEGEFNTFFFFFIMPPPPAAVLAGDIMFSGCTSILFL